MVNAFEQLKDIWSRFSGRGTYPHQLSGVLLVPLRRLISRRVNSSHSCT